MVGTCNTLHHLQVALHDTHLHGEFESPPHTPSKTTSKDKNIPKHELGSCWSYVASLDVIGPDLSEEWRNKHLSVNYRQDSHLCLAMMEGAWCWHLKGFLSPSQRRRSSRLGFWIQYRVHASYTHWGIQYVLAWFSLHVWDVCHSQAEIHWHSQSFWHHLCVTYASDVGVRRSSVMIPHLENRDT